MTEQNDNFETPPAVEPTHYDGPTKSINAPGSRAPTSSSPVLAVVFFAVILGFILTR